MLNYGCFLLRGLFLYLLVLNVCNANTLSSAAQADFLKALGQPSPEKVVQSCTHQAIDEDLLSTMTIVNRHRNGAEKKSIYTRLVKNPKGKDGVFEKMLLISKFPPEAAGMAFLRWEYTPDTGKYPDQWLYSPSLRNVRKVSIRDDEERFLGSTLTLADIGIREVSRDNHQILTISTSGDGYILQIESTAKVNDGSYSKRLISYYYEDNWDSCRVKQIGYYDKKGFLQKTQKNQWQMRSNIWVWQHVEVENHQTRELSIFELKDVEINVGLKDKIFSERTLRRASKLKFEK